MDISLDTYRTNGHLNHRSVGQQIRIFVDEQRLSLREVFKDFIESRLGHEGPEGLDIRDVVLLAEQSSANHTFAEGMTLLYYAFDLTPKNGREELLEMLSEAGFPVTSHLDRNQLLIAEDYLGLRRGTLYDMDEWE